MVCCCRRRRHHQWQRCYEERKAIIIVSSMEINEKSLHFYVNALHTSIQFISHTESESVSESIKKKLIFFSRISNSVSMISLNEVFTCELGISFNWISDQLDNKEAKREWNDHLMYVALKDIRLKSVRIERMPLFSVWVVGRHKEQ